MTEHRAASAPHIDSGAVEENTPQGRRRHLRSGSFCTPERQSSRRSSSGSKAVMFTDEIGNNLEEVKKYDEAEPITIPHEAEEDVEIENEDKFNNVENVRYLDESKSLTSREANMNMKIFGNPRVRKSQSFNHGSRPVKSDDSPECPKNSPLESVSTTPICSPVMVHRIPSVEHHPKMSLEKSQSFCSKLTTIPDESLSSMGSNRRPRLSKLSLPQPRIVLTSPLDSPQTWANIQGTDDKSRQFNASIEKLSEKLLVEGIETYLAIQHYMDSPAGGNQSSIRTSTSCPSLPPPPSSAPPPLPSL